MTSNAEPIVHLVGAGPGDPDLLTIKAHTLLRAADLVLHDDLVPPAILALASPQAIVVNVGKRCGVKKITQLEINRMMIASARRGMKVVRLKSGDPGIFGRLAEELDALEAAHIPFEVVPGITAAAAAAASVGVSLTDRRKSSRLIIVSAHQAQEKDKAEKPDWKALGREDATLAIYMPGRDLAPLAAQLLAAGLAPSTPAVLVSRAATPAQHQWCATLAELPSAPRLDSPSILLLGRSLDRAEKRAHAESSASASAHEGDWQSLLRMIGVEDELPASSQNENPERRFAL
jgi:uroporphyrin-III C-methyltransferase